MPIKLMQKLDKFFSKYCKPNTKAFPDENEAAITFAKNKFIFTVHLVIILLQICTFPFNGFNDVRSFGGFLLKILMLAIFLAFCRSRPFIGQTLNFILVIFLSFKVGYGHADAVYSSLIVAYAVPCVIYYLTQNVALTAIASLIQAWALQSYFKINLMEAVSFADPEVFAEKFTSAFVSRFILLQILNLYVVYSLNKKTAELLKASKKTEEALEQQKIFLYSFSHEMRNPMNSLLGNLDLALMSKQIAPEIREMIGTAKICGVLLLNLLNTVLDAGKLGLGKLEVNPVPTKVHDMFQKAWAISHDLITQKGLKSHLKISKQVPARLLLDGHRLNQVLMNLISNATKFTEYGSITLGVSWLSVPEVSDNCFKPIPYDDEDEGLFEKEYNFSAISRSKDMETHQSLLLLGSTKEFSFEGISQPETESKGVLKIVVKDTGCGMTKEDLGRLFQKFSQVGQITTKRQMGTGLGLYISKEIIENMRGEIRAYSKSKIGSTFIICIPTTALPVQPQSEHHISVHDQLIPKLREKRYKTIVADDSAFNVSLLCNFYSKIGVQVLATANNGQAAYDKYCELVKNKENIDIVTLDIDMPRMNGKEVCEKIRRYERGNDIKRAIIILISGNYEEEDMLNLLSRSNQNRPDCFLKKPLMFEELCWALYKYGG